ncbi:MAG: CoA transferase [Steroidobacteraceae bacterium]
MESAAFGALAGVRVVDLTQMLAGPYCTQMLADHGADVVKIEPLWGEDSRRTRPFHPDDRLLLSGGYYSSVNRNKRSVALDLKRPEAREIVVKLCAKADVVVENYRAGVMERLGLGYESLRAVNPKLVYAAIRGFGDPRTGKSPYMDWPAFDVVAQAMGGVMQINGPDKDSPLKVGPGIGDLVPALMCAFGIAAALLNANRTGRGQFLDVSMVDSILSLCERIVHQYSITGIAPFPEGNRHPLLCPFGLVRAKDGCVTIAAPTDAWWARICSLIGNEALISDPRTATTGARLANSDFVYGVLEAFTSIRTRRELMGIFGGQVPFGPVFDVADIMKDAHFSAREMIIEVPLAGVDASIKVAGVPVKMTETPGRVARRAPSLGEHTSVVLEEIGYEQAEIDRLRGLGIAR